jgi:DNA-binding GntR family transcriptional regulator
VEHRALHLMLFSRLGNPFVKGLLEAYWDAYAAVGLNVFSEYSYLCEVWRYHEGIVEAVIKGDRDEAYRLLVQHTQLLQQRDAVRAPRNGKHRNGELTTNGNGHRKPAGARATVAKK